MNFTNLFLAELWTTIKTHILDNLHIFRGLRLQIFRNLPKNVAVFRQNPPFSAIFHNWDHIMCSPLKIISESDKFSPFFFTDPEKLVWDGKFRNRWNLVVLKIGIWSRIRNFPKKRSDLSRFSEHWWNSDLFSPLNFENQSSGSKVMHFCSIFSFKMLKERKYS